MKHLGDITKIHGYDIERVDCITGGSPCQDLSVAGKRAGLAGARSGLFMEQVRIVKEMRYPERFGRADELVRHDEERKPRYLIWENVPGAMSSNFKDGYGDFGAVLEEIARVERPDFVLPRLPDKWKWSKAGCIDFDTFQVAWRIHDAQYFGVAQRRRRLCVCVDYNGHTAADIISELVGNAGEPDNNETVMDIGTERFKEVLLERESVQGDSEQSSKEGERPSGNSEKSAYGHDRVLGAVGINGDVAGTIDASFFKGCGERQGVEREVICEQKYDEIMVVNDQGGQSINIEKEDKAPTLRSQSKHHEPVIIYKEETPYTLQICCGCDGGGKGPLIQKDKSATLSTVQSQTLFQPVYCIENSEDVISEELEKQAMCYGLDRASFNQGKNAKYSFTILEEQAQTIVSKGPGAVCEPKIYDMTHADDVIRDCGGLSPTLQNRMGTRGNQIPITVQRIIRWIVRRLTPKECERLQGYPDDWTNIGEWTDSKGKKHKDADSPRYKAIGNSIALPFWYWMFCNMAQYLPDNATLGSLFDGIGGFPLCWEKIHGKGSAKWASEIEEFPIAVTKKHFKE